MQRFCAILIVAFLSLWVGYSSAEPLPEPPGTYLPKSEAEVSDLETFQEGNRLTGVYYFYWYRYRDACVGKVCNPLYTRSHIEFATGAFGKPGPTSALTHTPLDLEKMDFADPAWHRTQIERIASASVDLILPVFWGIPGRYGEDGHYAARWSKVGLEAFTRAMLELEKEGKTFPKVGMMYDTTTLSFESLFHPAGSEQKLSLTTPEGKAQFYATIRDFFSLIPPRFWALWEGHPLVWLYGAEETGGFDETTLPETKARFSQDFFGLSPWFVAHLDWLGAGADWDYRWGGAFQPSFLSVNSIGPGFDESGAFGEPEGSRVKRDREDGRYYRNAWEHALRSSAPVTVIETWNELHEGTEICPTREDGEKYLDITHLYASRFKTEARPKPLPGPFLGKTSTEWPGLPTGKGLTLVQAEDGEYRTTETADGLLVELRAPYLYFAVDDSFCFSATGSLEMELEFYDLPDRFGKLWIEYDSWDRNAQYHGIYKRTDEIPLTGSFRWKRETVSLPAARLANNQNGGADFRIVGPRGIRIREVRLKKGERPEGGNR